MDIERLNEIAIAEAKRLGAEDAIALAVNDSEKMLRFANNSPTVVKNIDEAELTVYVAKEKKRAIASTSNPEEANVKSFVGDLVASLSGLTASEYAPLPSRAMKFKPVAERFDKRIAEIEERLPELAGQAISSASQAGAKRSAGVINASVASFATLASNGTKGSDARTGITLNIRSFSDGDASGHGLSCASTMSTFDPTGAGKRAGEDAQRMVQAGLPEAGEYEVLLSPTVASNLLESVASAASAFSVEAGLSFLTDKLGQKVAADGFSLTDHGFVQGGLGGRAFDDEGMPTRSTKVVEDGVLKSYLHNLTTARNWKTETTGNAGLVTPRAWNIEIGAGDASYDEMVREMKNGVVLTSNWYTRFKNQRTGEFSTVPRDGAYLVKDGKVVRPLKGMRVSDSLQRIFSSVKMTSKERSWIEWWEVDTPTLCPWLLAEGVKVTKAFE